MRTRAVRLHHLSRRLLVGAAARPGRNPPRVFEAPRSERHRVRELQHVPRLAWARMLRDMLISPRRPVRCRRPPRVAPRKVANFLQSNDAGNHSLHAMALREEIDQLRNQSDHQLFHEQLEPYNQPFYFADFARCAATHGLQYLAEATPTAHTAATGAVAATFNPAPRDPIRNESSTSISLIGRTISASTLLCRAERPGGEARR